MGFNFITPTGFVWNTNMAAVSLFIQTTIVIIRTCIMSIVLYNSQTSFTTHKPYSSVCLKLSFLCGSMLITTDCSMSDIEVMHNNMLKTVEGERWR